VEFEFFVILQCHLVQMSRNNGNPMCVTDGNS